MDTKLTQYIPPNIVTCSPERKQHHRFDKVHTRESNAVIQEVVFIRHDNDQSKHLLLYVEVGPTGRTIDPICINMYFYGKSTWYDLLI